MTMTTTTTMAATTSTTTTTTMTILIESVFEREIAVRNANEKVPLLILLPCWKLLLLLTILTGFDSSSHFVEQIDE